MACAPHRGAQRTADDHRARGRRGRHGCLAVGGGRRAGLDDSTPCWWRSPVRADLRHVVDLLRCAVGGSCTPIAIARSATATSTSWCSGPSWRPARVYSGRRLHRAPVGAGFGRPRSWPSRYRSVFMSLRSTGPISCLPGPGTASTAPSCGHAVGAGVRGRPGIQGVSTPVCLLVVTAAPAVVISGCELRGHRRTADALAKNVQSGPPQAVVMQM